MVAGMGNQRGGRGGDEKWSRSGNTLNGSQQVCCWMWLGVWEGERGPASLAWELEGWSYLSWNEGDSQSSRLERERKRKNGISGGDSWILRCLLVPHVEILSSGGCSRRNWVKVNVWAYELHIKMRGVWGDSQGNMWGWGEENKEENPETV